MQPPKEPPKFTREWFSVQAKKGGHARAAKLSPKTRSEISRQAGLARQRLRAQKIIPDTVSIPTESATPTL